MRAHMPTCCCGTSSGAGRSSARAALRATRWRNGRSSGPFSPANNIWAITMILILSSNTDQQGADYRQLMDHLARLPGISTRVHVERGAEQKLTEIYLI